MRAAHMDGAGPNDTIVPVILAGGQGTRLWPMSRAARPKQFLSLDGAMSLFQQTLKRVADPARYGAPIVITHHDYRFLVAEQAQEIGINPAAILLEPMARNTAPAITAATLYAQKENPGAVLHILPSDHALATEPGYFAALETARRAAENGALVTFGVTPTAPETGYGYIEIGAERTKGVNDVARFVEKPDSETAQHMLDAGTYVWNSGMFVFEANTFLEEVAALAPEVLAGAKAAIAQGAVDLDFFRLDAKAFEAAPSISVDYAIFEKSSSVAVVPVSFDWSDLGSWDAVWKTGAQDAKGNVGAKNVLFSDSNGSLVLSEKAHVVLDGLDGVVLVASEDAIYAGRLDRAQNVGNIVKQLKSDAKTAPLTQTHTTDYRPWGGYTSVLMGERFQVKRLFVKPGKKLSLQRHHHRSEHWIVVSGTAEVTIDGKMRMVTENESVYLPVGCEHRLGNPGKILLELIEVQTGSYLGEDDIVRIEDAFGRT
ncbi:mannose-1-phosphate guanylyltransferase/mannose-6-phosphate isomerase [Pelagibacterium lentulum]|uniref:mannose-1-phosphate guanylyltransferase n=1 Tax=Pelagibacterium lentulum TaxID=2029865 RepID=A0A916R7G6_9HYPH|nr:mannose-1-phosphate guanylyltransferase/mannose-6-phosphate isomerase [Pelagibacterium lentulum]GGA39716.1 mannose-1-phosphate guanylyltransferase [Pelagibacterium lentulum]